MIDNILQNIIAGERRRQADEIEMIASENYVSESVMQAYANCFTNKYSEGYPGARYYGGQECVDQLERVTQHRALRVFGLLQNEDISQHEDTLESLPIIIDQLLTSPWMVNVQPLSGGPANAAVYLGFLRAGDTILAMDLAAGGHLSHGHKLNISGQNYTIVPYGVTSAMDALDYDDIRQKALIHKPAIIVAGFSAFVGSIEREKFSLIADEVYQTHGYRPLLMADIAHIAGLIAGSVLPSPFGSFDVVTTTTHKTLRGPRGALIFGRKGSRTHPDGRVCDIEKTINRGVFPGLQGGPHMHLIVAKAVGLYEVLQPGFTEYAHRVHENARVLAHELSVRGWPVLTGTTMNHMVLVDVTRCRGADEGRTADVEAHHDVVNTTSDDYVSTSLTGKIAEKILEYVGISINKNMLPDDTRSPLDPSGIRLGTPALTTRGMGPQEVVAIAGYIDDALRHGVDSSGEICSDYLEKIRHCIREICQKFPLYSG